MKNKKENTPSQPKGNIAKLAYTLSLAFQLGFVIVTPLVVFCFLGLKLDKKFNTQPNMFIIGLVGGLFVGAYSAYKWIYPIVKK